MSLIARSLTIYVCPYCNAKHFDRYETRHPRCPHRGDYFEAVEYAPLTDTQGAVTALRELWHACAALGGEDVSAEAETRLADAMSAAHAIVGGQ